MVLSLRDSMMESNNKQSIDAIIKQSEGSTDFVDQLRSYETKNRRVLTAREIQNFELAHNEYVMNYFMYHQQFNSIVEYETSFLQLKRWAETWNEESFDEDWVVNQFVSGIKEEIRNYVNLWRPDSLQRAIVLAKWQELCLVDKVFEKIPEPTKAKDNSEIKKEFVHHEEIEREQSMKVNSIGPFSLISSGHFFVFAPFISSSLINDCGCQAFEKYLEELRIPGSKLKENGLYWGERGKIDSIEIYFSNFLKPFLLYYDGCTMLVDCNFWCLSDINELGLQEFCLEGEKYMEVVHKSLGLLTQNFIILFLWSNVEIIFLGEAAMRTKVRQLYVIVNELQFSVVKFYIDQSVGIIEVFEDISQQEAQILWQTSKYFMAILKAKDKVKHENYLVLRDNKAGFHICFRRKLITKELEYHDVMSGKTAESESLGFNCDPGEIIVLKGNRECKGAVKFHLGDKVVVDGPGNACHALVKRKMGIGVAEQCSSWDNVPLLYKSIWTIQNGKFVKSSLLCTKIAPALGILKLYECYVFDQLNCMIGCPLLVSWHSTLLVSMRIGHTKGVWQLYYGIMGCCDEWFILKSIMWMVLQTLWDAWSKLLVGGKLSGFEFVQRTIIMKITENLLAFNTSYTHTSLFSVPVDSFDGSMTCRSNSEANETNNVMHDIQDVLNWFLHFYGGVSFGEKTKAGAIGTWVLFTMTKVFVLTAFILILDGTFVRTIIGTFKGQMKEIGLIHVVINGAMENTIILDQLRGYISTCVLVYKNVKFYAEDKNDLEFLKKLASFTDLFVKGKSHITCAIENLARGKYEDKLIVNVTYVEITRKGILEANEFTGIVNKPLSSIYQASMLRKLRKTEGHFNTVAGKPFVDVLEKNGTLPGTKVDKGTVELLGTNGEPIIQGVYDLVTRAKYGASGVRFAKWCVVLKIGPNKPSHLAINDNINSLTRYVIICQENGLVPIVELEIHVEGTHDINKCASVTECVLAVLVVDKLKGVLKISALKIWVPHTLGPATLHLDEHDGFKKNCGLVGIMKVIHWGLIRSTLLPIYVLCAWYLYCSGHKGIINVNFTTNCHTESSLFKRSLSESIIHESRRTPYYGLRLVIYIMLELGLGIISFKGSSCYGTIQAKDLMFVSIALLLKIVTTTGFPSFVKDMKVFTCEKQNEKYGVGVFIMINTLSIGCVIHQATVVGATLLFHITNKGVGMFFKVKTNIPCMVGIEKVKVKHQSFTPKMYFQIAENVAHSSILILSRLEGRSDNGTRVHQLYDKCWRLPMS